MQRKHSKLRTVLSTLAVGAALVAPVATPSPARALAAAEPTQEPALEGKANLNTAPTDLLELLPGVGPTTAARIVAYRERHPFKDVLHVLRIKGIGRKKFRRMRPFLTIDGPNTLRRTRAVPRPVSDPKH